MAEAEQRKTAAPGWYPDPKMPGTVRFWDGAKWSEHVAPMGTGPSEKRDREKGLDALTIAGAVMVVLFPPGGFVAGAILLARRALVGTVIMLLSVLLFVAWYLVITSDDDLDCARENVDRSQQGLPLRDCT